MTYILLLCSAALLSFVLAFPARWLALSLNVVDRPEKRKMHQIPIPLLGGLAVGVSFGLVSAAAMALAGAAEESALRSYAGLMLGACVILAAGIYDDIRGMKAPMKFAAQALAALVVVATGTRIDLFTNPLGESIHMGWLGIPLTIFWVVGVTNAVNLIDGLDGLAVGIGGIAALGLFAVSVSTNPFLGMLTIILVGAAAGFLPHNFYPAKIFLGDTGSMFIGFTLAVIGLHGSLKATTATVLFLPIVVLGMPIFDTCFAILRRARRRVSPFKADREHIHHRLVRIGLHHRNVVLVLYFVSAYLGITAYAIAQFPYQTAFLFIVMLTMVGIIGLRTLRFIEEKLETGLKAQEASPGLRASGPARKGRRRTEPVSTVVCEIEGVGESFGDASELRAAAADITAMLSRRIRVHGLRLEPTLPGRVMLILRTGEVKPSLGALIQDGLVWYFQEHRERSGAGSGAPAIRWIAGPSDQTAPASSGGARAEAAPLPFHGGRATAAGS
ncbi:MAG TPA: MraY family glycosyltransferase [Candidatus Polarisedimenticolia bacterium]|nr:MraY family glycosyltransferase [Candidatus Polarisedimenticolia bacterium]